MLGYKRVINNRLNTAAVIRTPFGLYLQGCFKDSEDYALDLKMLNAVGF
jgi:hypothetical protein